MTTKYFYQNMRQFSRFSDVVEDQYFESIPDDWIIVITDIKSSTQAIENGQYKNVNTIGAASIVSVNNVMQGIEFPCIFGGDGAVLLIPPEFHFVVEKELSTLQQLSKQRFNLDLRIGIITVKEIIREGAKIEVAKFTLVGKQNIACVRGGGVSLADKKIKGNEKKYAIKTASLNKKINLGRLSCRWKEIPAKNGMVVTILVMHREKASFSVYKKFFDMLRQLFENNLDDANPVNISGLSYKNINESISLEKKLHYSLFSKGFFKRAFQTLLSTFIFKIKLLNNYKNSIRIHSDYQKFDDMLRMVIDCKPEQAKTIHAFLTTLYDKEEIYFGLHASKKALMTCFVDSLKLGHHIHFIDGHNGGYALAAKKMKAQIKNDTN